MPVILLVGAKLTSPAVAHTLTRCFPRLDAGFPIPFLFLDLTPRDEVFPHYLDLVYLHQITRLSEACDCDGSA